MTSHERFAAAMAHRAPDRAPIDIGGTSLTGMRPGLAKRLCAHLGFPESPDAASFGLDERIMEWARTDFRNVGGICDLPSPLKRILSPTAHVDCWGVKREFIDGEWQITGSPLQGAIRDDLASFPWPEPRVDDTFLEQVQARAKALHDDGRYLVVADHPVFGILELGCWMCGYGDFMLKLAADPDFVRDYFDRIFAFQIAALEPYYAAIGPYIDVTTSGDDFGTQRAPFMSRAMFSEFIAPYFKERIARTKELGQCYYWHHSCGSIFDLLDLLIDCGVDILNPVQTSASKMEPKTLKQGFGNNMVFWGAVDVQHFLRNATPREVQEEIASLLSILGENGGYVIAPAHEIQEDIPVENIVAWVEAMR